MYKKIIIFILSISVISLLASCASTNNANDKESITMKIGHTMVDDSTRNEGAEKIKEYVEKESDGKIKVEIYPNSQLGNSKEQVEGVQTGSIEMVIFPSTSVTDFQPLFSLMDVPFLLPTDKDEVAELYKTDSFRDFMDLGDEVGIKVLYPWFEGFGTIASKKKVTTPDDIKGLKMRIIGGDISDAHYAKLGAKIDTIAFNEVYTSLQTGRIDTIDIPPHQLYDNKFYEVVDNVVQTNHWALHDFVMVNQGWYEGLSSEFQDIIAQAAVEAAPFAEDKLDELTEKSIDEMKDYGVDFSDPNDELIDRMTEIGEELQEKYVEDYGDEAEEILNNMKEDIKKIK